MLIKFRPTPELTQFLEKAFERLQEQVAEQIEEQVRSSFLFYMYWLKYHPELSAETPEVIVEAFIAELLDQE